MKSDPDKSPPPKSGPEEPPAATSGAGDRALVVDDEKDIRETIASALVRVGYEVETAASADEALEVFSRRPCDVVISDWRMPGQDGIELVSHLKKRDPDLATILITGYGTEETVIDAFTRGKINYYLSKPFRVNELLETVGAAVKERKLHLSGKQFRERLEREIQRATEELEGKNVLLEEKRVEAESLYRELKGRQEEIQQTKEYLEHLLESSVDAIISVDSRYRINFFSRGAEEMFGFRGAEVMGFSMERFFASGQEDLDRLLARMEEEKRLKHFEVEMIKRGGQRLITDISVSFLRHQEEDLGLLFIIKDIAEQKRLEEELRASNIILEKLSITDGLTNLYNHRHFQFRLAEEFQRAKRFETHLSLLMADLDDFKEVNDTYGHQVGDQVLVALADLIQESIREVDTPARYGGEEFAVIVPQTDMDSATHVAQRIKNSVEHSPRLRALAPGLKVTVSLGVSGFPDPGVQSTQDLIRFADRALYRAKQIGKNRIVVGGSREQRPVGRGERLTQGEKKAILRRVSETLRSTLNLQEVLDFVLREIQKAFEEPGRPLACSVMLANEEQQFETVAEANLEEARRPDFQSAAEEVLKTGKVQVFSEKAAPGPITSYPIVIDSAERGPEVVGVINLGTVPADLDFFGDLVNQAALGIENARLYHELEVSKQALEEKVDELTVLALMSMALQRNALTLEDFRDENRHLVARALGQIGFDRVLVFDYDRKNNLLVSGVDNTLRSDEAPQRVSLAGLRPQSVFRRALVHKETRHLIPVFTLSRGDDLDPAERDLLAVLEMTEGEAALAPLIEHNQAWGLVVALKERVRPEDREVLSMFLLHASLILENLNLSAMYQDKTRRLALVHEIGASLSASPSLEARRLAAQQTLERLTTVLDAGEISVYLYHPRKKALRLLAYASQTAGPGQKPAELVKLGDSQLMGRVVRRTKRTGRAEPLAVADVEALLGKRTKKRFATKSYLGLPLWSGGELLGVMNVADKLDRTVFGPEDVELAETAAGMLALSLSSLIMSERLNDQALEAVSRLVSRLEALGQGSGRGHSRRVADLAVTLARSLGREEAEMDVVRRAAVLHDVGKDYGTPGPAAGEEDSRLGVRLLGEWLAESHPAIMPHPERENGRGFPEGLTGTDLPWPAKVIAVADAFDTLFLVPAPRKRPPLEEVLYQLLEKTGTELDQAVVEALFRILREGELKIGRRRVKAGPEVFRALARRLSRKDSPLPAALRQDFLDLIRTRG